MSRPGVTDEMIMEHLQNEWDRCTTFTVIASTEPFKSLLAEEKITPRMIRYALQRLRAKGDIESRGWGRGVVYRITPDRLEDLQ